MPGNLLIVDDDDSQRRSLAIGLRLAGFRVHDVATAEAALELLEVEQFDLALTDLMMPGLNGLQLIRRMFEHHPNLPVVLMSAYQLSRHQLERVGVNMVAFVPKPYNLDELADFLAEKIRPEAAIAAG